MSPIDYYEIVCPHCGDGMLRFRPESRSIRFRCTSCSAGGSACCTQWATIELAETFAVWYGKRMTKADHAD